MVIISSDGHYRVNPTEEVKVSVKPLDTLSTKEWSIPKDMELRYFESRCKDL
ncbi:hypothetical protein K503DRAFT_777084 [Rhizopogon vinicolor AM-OR11-026]|uniref:Uncharacterized protein n=1 Tax=Rhizopogon vinicolor AM-OR11-026 TaxID=1314800 RepID=A0A1B7MHD5_9AGAM|nr:hypothetical protein K503DRAFT_777084 [Rhizopogon vinicolor AM-OR11-026]